MQEIAVIFAVAGISPRGDAHQLDNERSGLLVAVPTISPNTFNPDAGSYVPGASMLSAVISRPEQTTWRYSYSLHPPCYEIFAIEDLSGKCGMWLHYAGGGPIAMAS